MEISYASSSSTDIGGMLGRQVKVIPLQHPEVSNLSAAPTATLLMKWLPNFAGMSSRDWMTLVLPCSRWIRSYKWKEYLQIDLMAGITVGVMLVPQVN